MAFTAIYNTKNDIPADHVEHYTEVDGKFHLDTDFKALGMDVSGLTASQERLKRERLALRDEVEALKPLKKFEKLLDREDFNPDELDTLIAAADGAGNKDAIEALQRKHQKELEKLATERDEAKKESVTASSEKDNYIITNSLQSAAVEANVRKGSLDDVVSLNRNSVKIVDGVVTFVDAEGDPTVTPLEFFQGDYKKDKSHFYEPEGPGGTGNPSKGNNNVTDAAKSYKEAKTPAEKLAAVKAQREAQGLEV